MKLGPETLEIVKMMRLNAGIAARAAAGYPMPGTKLPDGSLVGYDVLDHPERYEAFRKPPDGA